MYNKVIELNDLIVNSPDFGIFKVISEKILFKIVDISTKLTEINYTLYKININFYMKVNLLKFLMEKKIRLLQKYIL